MRRAYIFIFLSFFSQCIYSQVKNTDDLYLTAKKLDSLIFKEGFNKCNPSHYNTIISDDLEFYHDVGGVSKGKEAFVASVKNNICSTPGKVKRELIPNSMLVYPMYNNKTLYGFIQEGNHEFFENTNGKWNKTGQAKFTHLWILENNQWKLKRVLSYNH
ncbi:MULTISPECIES: DUF4440 domain-containing protein [unclassified Chryseobacterium]|uniref:DUF4440 domain-containing protein n=1 Tax=unclassified Chryseobacterium TaxID=2593645 RepID=UPI00100BAE0A|nr:MULTISPECIES: DUF4440 domain-containing protein [unclassified Chryseobacterium]RXM51489.1 DUF4440 domain-containing protein [Chryseobacterium sp. CH25]RXM67059.1 DUF4440 domain-containing protein [Chryseobacterium sp. CH1]